jgi:amino acid transporter
VGQAVAVALYLIGFGEALASKMFTDWMSVGVNGTLVPTTITGDQLWDVRLWSVFALILLLIMALIGVGWVIKIQLFLLAGILFILLSVYIGCGVNPTEPIPGNTSAFVGFSYEALVNNTNPAYTDGNTFFSVFAVFFPAVTGIMAGANLSGDLKNPGKDIPLGTFISIGFSTLMYIILAVWTGATCFRTRNDGTGGLYFNELIMEDMSFWAPLIIIGIFAACLSSALASLVGAPRIAQAWCKDHIFVGKGIEKVETVFAKGRKNTNDPIAG